VTVAAVDDLRTRQLAQVVERVVAALQADHQRHLPVVHLEHDPGEQRQLRPQVAVDRAAIEQLAHLVELGGVAGDCGAELVAIHARILPPRQG
jgi:hypothetical protein